MNSISVHMDFENRFRGELRARNAAVPVGGTSGTLAPYDLMLGALGACWYATFVDIARKMGLAYERLSMDIRGEKRAEVPTTLREVSMDVTVFGAAQEKGFERAAQLASKYCSVHHTIEQVARITQNLRFA